METKITVIDKEGQLKVRVEEAYNADHVVWLLSRAIQTIVTPEVQEEGEQDAVQDVPKQDIQDKPESDVLPSL